MRLSPIKTARRGHAEEVCISEAANDFGSVTDLHTAGLFLDQKRFHPPFDFLAKIDPDLDQLQFGITAARD